MSIFRMVCVCVEGRSGGGRAQDIASARLLNFVNSRSLRPLLICLDIAVGYVFPVCLCNLSKFSISIPL